jgi:hypothetical protein
VVCLAEVFEQTTRTRENYILKKRNKYIIFLHLMSFSILKNHGVANIFFVGFGLGAIKKKLQEIFCYFFNGSYLISLTFSFSWKT